MIFDYSKLRGRIIEKYGSHSAFARELGISNRSFSLKINNKVPFSQPEIKKTVCLLAAEDKEIPSLFFTKEVQKVEHKKQRLERNDSTNDRLKGGEQNEPD